MHVMLTVVTIIAVWSTIAFAQTTEFPMTETGDNQREYHIRAPLTTGDSYGMMGGMLSCKQLKGPMRQSIEGRFTSEGKTLCHRVLKIKGIVEVRLNDYTVQITKAKAFEWNELEMPLRESFSGL